RSMATGWRSPLPSKPALAGPRILRAVSTPGKTRADQCLPAGPLQLFDKHVERLGQHHTAAYRKSLRKYDALFQRIKPLERRVQKKSAAVILRAIPCLRYDKQIGPGLHDGFQRSESASA